MVEVTAFGNSQGRRYDGFGGMVWEQDFSRDGTFEEDNATSVDYGRVDGGAFDSPSRLGVNLTRTGHGWHSLELDRLGRIAEKRWGQRGDTIVQRVRYDGAGRATRVSNPTVVGDQVGGGTLLHFDALGRRVIEGTLGQTSPSSQSQRPATEFDHL